jgi:hypothetical protein
MAASGRTKNSAKSGTLAVFVWQGKNMHDDFDIPVEKLILTQMAYMNAGVNGIIVGLLFGIGIFAATNFLLLKGGEVVGPHLALLGEFFFGYSVSFKGSLVGFAYGFGTGYLTGYLFSILYNWVARWRELAAKRIKGE